MKSTLNASLAAAALTASAMAWTPSALAHAFPEREEPAVGSVVHYSPQRVRIWFDSRIEREFSVIVVKDKNGNKVSGNTSIDPKSFQMLEVVLQALAPGTYRVYWAVVSWDGHRTKGDYSFSVAP